MISHAVRQRLPSLLRSTAITASRVARVRLPAASLQHVATSLSTLNFSTQTASSDPKDPVFVPDMLCRQCEQTADHIGCTTQGVCGKTSETSALQDALLDSIKSLSLWCVAAREAGLDAAELEDANVITLKATFSTLTNVNFSSKRIADYIRKTEAVKMVLKEKVLAKGGSVADASCTSLTNLNIGDMSDEELEEFGYKNSGITLRSDVMNHPDAFSLNEIGTYGMKGVCAYATHVYQLQGNADPEIMAEAHEIFAKLASPVADMDGLLSNVMRVGQLNAKVLAQLDAGHADSFGAPEPTAVRTSAVQGKAILVSGHDIKDLYHLLEQTKGTGVNVYTHGEMLPAHAYPKLKEFDHLKGNYGTAWQNQKFEFATFPGPIIVTTNCILEPRRVYKDRLYTMNEVGLDGIQHIGEDRDFTAVIEQAKQMKGFQKDVEPPTFHTTGFNHRVVLPLADKVIEAAKSGALSRILLIGGCDGSQWDRSYFTTLAEESPDDSLILTLGCAKNRVIHIPKLQDATLSNGLPRVLDMGQCNDSYSAVVVATELAKALDCSVNDLPLSLALSHLEQKAAAVLLTLLSMGVKNIRLGPSLPAYVSPGVLKLLVENYNLMGLGEAEKDLKAMMQGE